ncbi:MAG: domain containing protein [Verrucomicrobiaceae bacterium]|nr:domain containing protein [Verrucomicrobiaceae bacterium]
MTNGKSKNKNEVRVRKARTPALNNELTAHDAMRAVMLECLLHLQSNVIGVMESAREEPVHQARVALRRIRSAQKAFAKIAPEQESKSINGDILWLAKLLGDVRDIDVFLIKTLPTFEADIAGSEPANFSRLKQSAEQRREVSRQKLRDALISPRFTNLQLQIVKSLARNEAVNSKSEQLIDFTRRSLRKRWRRVVELIALWDSLDRRQRHTLRKRAKKLRYAVEFFSSLYKTKSVKKFTLKLEQVQQDLGNLNDAVTTQALMKSFADDDVPVAQQSGIVIGWISKNANEAERDVEKSIVKLCDAKKFW